MTTWTDPKANPGERVTALTPNLGPLAPGSCAAPTSSPPLGGVGQGGGQHGQVGGASCLGGWGPGYSRAEMLSWVGGQMEACEVSQTPLEDMSRQEQAVPGHKAWDGKAGQQV